MRTFFRPFPLLAAALLAFAWQPFAAQASLPGLPEGATGRFVIEVIENPTTGQSFTEFRFYEHLTVPNDGLGTGFIYTWQNGEFKRGNYWELRPNGDVEETDITNQAFVLRRMEGLGKEGVTQGRIRDHHWGPHWGGNWSLPSGPMPLP